MSNFIKKQKGITLIALVITIIVLLILAGVAIAMLSGENGILKQAAGAKVEYEEASKAEEGIIDSTVIQMDVISERLSNVQGSYGFVTGTNLEKLSDLGYTFEANEMGNISTGAKVIKDHKVVSTVVIYGDLNGDGSIDGDDALAITNLNNDSEDYMKVAADVNFDGYINVEDQQIIINVIIKGFVVEESIQNESAQDSRELVIETLEQYYGRIIDELGFKGKIVKKELYVENRKQYYKVDIGNQNLSVEEVIGNSSETNIFEVVRDGEPITKGNIENGDRLEFSKMYKSGEEYYEILSSKLIAEFVVSE